MNNLYDERIIEIEELEEEETYTSNIYQLLSLQEEYYD